jgi:beta-glucanase (GH16 family)
MTWHDEFKGANDSLPDPKKWLIETGGNGWGNDELESYTECPQNMRQENGNLIIEAIQEKYTGSDGIHRDYTSGRMITKGLFSQKYGRFEARIKNPKGRGLWPAFWLLPDDFYKVGWPACGEIDIMEEISSVSTQISGSVHGPGYSGLAALTSSFRLPKGDFSDGFHVFALEWEPQVLRFYVDGQRYATFTPSNLPSGAKWVYDKPFFIILNLAVREAPSNGTGAAGAFPQRMLVDYVRVYARK